jgi:MFS family permease
MNIGLSDPLVKDLRHNLTVNLLDGAFFGFAMGFASFVTIIPLFVRTMTSSAMLIGLIPAIHNVGWQLPQLFTASWVARQKRFKPLVLALTVHERLPFLGLALVGLALPWLGNSAALVIIFAMLVWQGLGAGLTANPWQSMIAKIFPSEWRGTFLGGQSSAANLLASLAAILAGYILQRFTGPMGFAWCFLLASSMMVVSWIFLARTREPSHELAIPNRSAAPLNSLANLRRIMRRDHNFRWFVIARVVSHMALMGYAFFTVYAVDRHGVSLLYIGWITGTLLGVQIIANVVMGWIGDHWSHRRVMEIGLLAVAGSALLAWWAPSPGWFFLVFTLAAIGNVAIWTIGMAMVFEFGAESERPTYIGLANTLVAPADILTPFIGGWLADAAGFPATFLASAGFSLLAAALFHFLVKDQKRWHSDPSVS